MTQEFFSDKSSSPFANAHFHQVIALHEEKNLKWEDISRIVPILPRGWFELSTLSKEDRIDFTLQYWLSKLTFATSKGIFLEERLINFFENMQDIGIYVTQDHKMAAFDVHMIYSLKEEIAYFHGCPPASVDTCAILAKQFETIHFPKDYLGFLEIHDGFSKYFDRGLIKTKEMAKTYLKFQDDQFDETLLLPTGQPVDLSTLIPFYESEVLHGYRCFYADFVPELEMGNIYLSQLHNQNGYRIFDDGPVYPTFISWFLDYLEERCTE